MYRLFQEGICYPSSAGWLAGQMHDSGVELPVHWQLTGIGLKRGAPTPRLALLDKRPLPLPPPTQSTRDNPRPVFLLSSTRPTSRNGPNQHRPTTFQSYTALEKRQVASVFS